MKVIRKKDDSIVLHFSAKEVSSLKTKLGLVTHGDLVGTLVDLKSADLGRADLDGEKQQVTA